MPGVLVVDDEPAIPRVVGMVLLELGCDIYTAEDAETALALCEKVQPAFILADVRLPAMDGVELTRRILVGDTRRNTSAPVPTACA